MAAKSHHVSAREARVNLLERFRGALHSAYRRTRHDQISNQRGERGIAAGESKIHAGRAARRVRRRTRFRDAIARGEPAEKLIRASRDANADLPARGSIISRLLHDGSKRSGAEEMALLHDRHGAADFFEIGEYVRADENGFPFAI